VSTDIGAPQDAPEPAVDPARVEEFAGKLFDIFTAALVSSMIDLGHRTGLLEALTAGSGTSQEIADRAGLNERYVRECLGALVTADIVNFDSAQKTYSMPVEHAVCLTGAGSMNLAPISLAATQLTQHVPGVARVFKEGGGVPYEEFRPEFTQVMDGLSRGLMDGQLLDGILPLNPSLPARLTEGIRCSDVGCGTGHALNLMARAYPKSTFVGYDLAEDAIAQARAEAAEYGLNNITFEPLDVTRLPTDPPFDVVFAFDAIHDQVDPSTVLKRIHDALKPGGEFVMMDIKANSALENNIDNPLAPFLYSFSTLHCMTVSLAHDGAGLGTVWGEQLAKQMLSDTGFIDIEVHDVPDDPMDSLYIARKPA